MKIRKTIVAALCALGAAGGVAAPAQAYQYTPAMSQRAWQEATHQALHYTGGGNLSFQYILKENYWYTGGVRYFNTYYVFRYSTSFLGACEAEVVVFWDTSGWTNPHSGACQFVFGFDTHGNPDA